MFYCHPHLEKLCSTTRRCIRDLPNHCYVPGNLWSSVYSSSPFILSTWFLNYLFILRQGVHVHAIASCSIVQRAEEKFLELILVFHLVGAGLLRCQHCATRSGPIGQRETPANLSISTLHLSTRVLGLQMCASTSGCLRPF